MTECPATFLDEPILAATARLPSWFEFIRRPRLLNRIQAKDFQRKGAKVQRRKGLKNHFWRSWA